MTITVVKKYQDKEVIKASRIVKDVEQLIIFAATLGVVQDFEQFVEDFATQQDRTYIVNLDMVH